MAAVVDEQVPRLENLARRDCCLGHGSSQLLNITGARAQPSRPVQNLIGYGAPQPRHIRQAIALAYREK